MLHINLTCPNKFRCKLALGLKAIMLSVPMNIYTGKETCKECGCLLEKVKI
jgi:hypothetical protein